MKHLIICILIFTTFNIYSEKSNSDLIQEADDFRAKEQYSHAIISYERLFTQGFRTIQTYFSYAYCCTMLGQVEKAIATYNAILKHDPHIITAIYNLAYVFKMAGLIKESIPLYEKIIELDPTKEEAYFGLGMAYLVNGDFKKGWEIHERYLKRTQRNADLLRIFLHDDTVAEKTILLRQEGGFGDVFQFIRYAKKLKDLNARVLVSVDKILIPLLSRCPYIDALYTNGSPLKEAYHDHTTLMSMSAIWYSRYESLVTEIPYLYADPEHIAYWKDKLAHDTNFKIGICWGASIHNDSSRPPVARRSIPLKELYILSFLPNISLYSLQRFDGEEQIDDIPSNIIIHRFDKDFDHAHGSFMDTAAVMHHLDLIISVDSAIAHLAGALGRPVYLMLPYATDWRWIANKTDTPWYPTMQIFKQHTPFDWHSVVQEIYTVLHEKLSEFTFSYSCTIVPPINHSIKESSE